MCSGFQAGSKRCRVPRANASDVRLAVASNPMAIAASWKRGQSPKMATNAILGNFVCIGNIRNHSNFPKPVAERRCNSMLPKSGLHHRSICWRHREVVEIHMAVGLGPQADAPRHRRGQDVLQVALPVEVRRDLWPGDADLEVMPLTSRRGSVANPFHRGSLAFLEFP